MAERDDELAEQLLNLFVYAPVGLALEARELIPKLAERGKGQVALTRLAATVAANKGQAEAAKFAGDFVSALEDLFGMSDTDDEPEDDSAADGTADTSDKLPIDHYDSMTAPQIIALLPDLSEADLAAVATYEQGNRKRVTILNKIAQLQSA